MFDNFATKEVGELQDVVDVVEGLDVCWLVHHADVIEDVVLPSHKLEENNSHGPQIRLVVLMLVVDDGLEGHVSLGPDLVLADDFEAVGKSLINFKARLLFCDVFAVQFHPLNFGGQLPLVLEVDLGESEVDDHALSGGGIVKKVARLDVPVVDAQVLQIFEALEQFVEVETNVIHGEAVKERLGYP